MILILILALVVRLLAWLILPEFNFPDLQNYIDSGQQLFAYGEIGQHHVMPLYPIVTYLLGEKYNIIFFGIILSVFNVFMIYQVSYLLFNNKRVSCIAMLIWSVYPFSIFYSITGLTETFFVSVLMTFFYFMYKNKVLPAFILAALSVLIRPTLELFFPVVIFLFSYLVLQKKPIESWLYVAKYLLVYMLIMSPWWLHQYDKYNQFVRLNLGAGIVLYTGHNILNKEGRSSNDPVKGVVVDFTAFHAIDDPIVKDNALKKAAVDYAISNPFQTLKTMGYKFVNFWNFWPYASQYNKFFYILISLLSYGLMFVLALMSFKYLKYKQINLLMPIYLLFAYMTLVHMILISSIRYRFPLEIFLIILASFTINNIFFSKGKKLWR